jgi:hypothetical protein
VCEERREGEEERREGKEERREGEEKRREGEEREEREEREKRARRERREGGEREEREEIDTLFIFFSAHDNNIFYITLQFIFQCVHFLKKKRKNNFDFKFVLIPL